MKSAPLLSTWITAILFLACAPAAIGQPKSDALKLLFDSLLASSGTSQLPDNLQVSKVLDGVPEMDPATITEALPLIDRALGDRDIEVRKYGLLTLLCLDQRPDGASFVGQVLPSVERELNDPDFYVRNGAIAVLSLMRPAPPDGVIAVLLAQFAKEDPKSPLRTSIIATLIKARPQDARTCQAVNSYLSDPEIGPTAQIAVLTALGTNPGFKSDSLIDLITTFVSPAYSKEVRLAAIDALGSVSPAAAPQARQTLSLLAADEREKADLRDAARQSLRELDRSRPAINPGSQQR